MGVDPGARQKFGPPQSDDKCRGSGGFSARNVLNLGSLKWHFLHFESTFK